MKSNELRRRLDKNRTMVPVSIRMPEDVIEDLKRIAPQLGFSGYQPLIRAYIGQALRQDLMRLENSPRLELFVESLQNHGVDAKTIEQAMADVMPPDALSYGYVETVEAMTSGLVFSNITWPAAGKNANDPETSSTVGNWGYATVPGYVVGGSVNQKSMSAPGYTILVSNYSDIDKEAAYLYTQWFTSPENLIQANQNLGGNTDVVRASIFANPAMAELFPGAGAYLDAQKANLAQAVPDPVLPGYGEYAQALEIEISNALTGQKSPQEALDDAAAAWDEITDAFGREAQLAVWQNFLAAISG